MGSYLIVFMKLEIKNIKIIYFLPYNSIFIKSSKTKPLYVT
ncbi:hypothetical protein RG47T_1045 [Mucilaginibacter polytrichastri]|uniref:Uncharacterized protein n=1 Tax=Mucilaginibacter polytrichastri TaxID=1302689 RepID=A0A1Q5ZUY8_9SPHI|nr:hypothetical protein RG47T_1045 [Mucilaginibacter polytrichastri]SFS35930.1 hypothetical protein SAMN04487890_10158 [Mucilaginibacter polytrichastri]